MIKAQAAIWLVSAGAVATVGAAVGATQLLGSSSNTTSTSAAPAAASSNGNNGNGNGNNGQASNKSLTVGNVNVTGLVPGKSIVQQLAIGNPNNQDVELQTVKTVVGGPTPSGACSSPTDVEVIVAGYNASTGVGPVVTIPKNSSLNLPVTVRMNNTAVNQNGCKGRTFNFTFTASANSK